MHSVCDDVLEQPLQQVESGQSDSNQRVQINVRGEMFETYEQTLSRFPCTLLGSRTKRNRYYNPLTCEYFFDRDKAVFNAILFFYQSNGILSKPETVSYEIFLAELKFFQLDGCHEDSEEGLENGLPTRRGCCRKVTKLRKNVWKFFEQPVTPVERIFIKSSLMLTVLSLVSLCLETLPFVTSKGREEEYDIIWSAIEVIFTGWFTVEFVIRFACAPNLAKFACSFGALADIMAISPFFVSVIAQGLTNRGAVDGEPFTLIRVMRLARILKLKRYSVGIRLLFETISDSREHMALFAYGILFNTVLLSSLVYYFEGEGELSSDFTSIPATFWFTVITLSSVGYGDYVPVSAAGKLVGAFSCIGGTVAMFCFTPVLFAEFRKSWQRFYEEMLEIKRQRGENFDDDDQVHYRTQTVRLRCSGEQALFKHTNPKR